MSQCVKQIACFIHSEINCCWKIQQETLPYTCIYILEKRVWYVRQISGFHRYTGQLLSKADRLENPRALHYDRQTRQLLVANATTSAFIYSVDYQ
jgi:hypothetical protein